MIYSGYRTDPALNFPSSGSGSRPKVRIHADPDPEPTYIKKVLVSLEIIKNTLNSIKKKNLKSIYHSLFHTTVQHTKSPEFTLHSFIYLLFHILLDPDPGKSSGSMRIRIRNTAFFTGSGSVSFVPGSGSVSKFCLDPDPYL